MQSKEEREAARLKFSKDLKDISREASNKGPRGQALQAIIDEKVFEALFASKDKAQAMNLKPSDWTKAAAKVMAIAITSTCRQEENVLIRLVIADTLYTQMRKEIEEVLAQWAVQPYLPSKKTGEPK